MLLELWRYRTNGKATLGFLMVKRDNTWEHLCFVCEDPAQDTKIAGKTRIPAGRYEIKLRREGGMNARYAAKHLQHDGMLWLQDVPGFEWIYIHIGSTALDTSGCLLVGEGRNEDGCWVHHSRSAYETIYPEIAAAVKDEGAWITVRDLDQPQWPRPPV